MDLQTVFNKIKEYESYYTVSQWPGGWTGDMVGLTPEELLALSIGRS